MPSSMVCKLVHKQLTDMNQLHYVLNYFAIDPFLSHLTPSSALFTCLNNCLHDLTNNTNRAQGVAQ